MENKRELLFSVTRDDLQITFFSGTGAGGQHRNKHMNAVRMNHKESGATATASRERSRDQNLKEAFDTLINHSKFKAWHKKKAAEMMMTKAEKETEKLKLDAAVDEAMQKKNIKIEVTDENGNWITGDINEED